MFPFAFTVQMQHTVTGKGLQTRVTITNEDHRPMPCYAGFHPYFLTPLDQKAAIRLSMNARERYAYNDSYTAVTGRLDLPAFPVPIHTPDMNEQLFCIPVGTKARLSYPDQSHIVLACDTDAPQDLCYIQTFTHTHQPFFCVEPWMNIPNTLNAITDRPVMAPGQKQQLTLSIELVAPSSPSS
jgi:galactose mutarotase-like enzyme